MNYSNLFQDQRLSAREHQLVTSLYKAPTNSIQSLSVSEAEQKAYYRFLNNKKVTETALSHEMALRCSTVVTDQIVLCIQA